MNDNNGNNIDLMHFRKLAGFPLFHFFTTIAGGVSDGNYSTFNLGFYCGDNPENVYENRERLSSELGVSLPHIYIPYQTHEDKVYVIDEHFLNLTDNEKYLSLQGVDALITDRKNICIGITTADCVPILIYDAVRNILAAVHAGWKGTVAKIIEKTIDKMVRHFGCDDPQALVVGIGPCISQKYFEVGEEVVTAFINAGFIMNDIAYRNEQTGKMHLDLAQANQSLLVNYGIPLENIEVSNLCTYSNPDKFFSARRQTVNSGRMITGGILS